MMLTLARTTIAIMLFLALMLFGTIIGARALPAVEEHLFFLCDDVGLLALKYADPKAAGTPVDFIVLVPGKAVEGIRAIRVIKGEIFLGDERCKRAKITLCPIEQNPTERTC
jgi:hypothetical protein